MKTILNISLIIITLASCKVDGDAAKIDWNKELIGVGYCGTNKDSLTWLFSYFPIANNQPERVKYYFNTWPIIKSDSIIFPNQLLRPLFRNNNHFKSFAQDSSIFLISFLDSLIQFKKVSGHRQIPSILYFNKFSSQFPKRFKYQFADGMDDIDNHEIEIVGDKTFNAKLKGSPYNPYLFELNKLDSIDKLFVYSYLNLIISNRYDTVDFRDQGAIFCGIQTDEKVVYNDSIFNYTTYFRRTPGSGLLVNYLRSKVDNEKHGLKEYIFNDEDVRAKSKEFKNLPIAIEKVWF